MPQLAGRFRTLPEYPLATIPQRKRELAARGVDVIDLGAGDADLAPPQKAIDALTKGANTPAMQRYGFGLGLVAYREAITAWMSKRFGLRFDPLTEIVPLIGSKEGISHLALAYLEPGRVAIIPEPGYNAYQGGALLAGAEPYRYALRPRTDFLVDLDEMSDETLHRARILYLNYPNNPTAAIAPRDYLERVVAKCREYDILLVYDNAYSELAFDGYRPPSIFEIDGARDVAIEFHSLSKTYNMTGWRCGWAVASARDVRRADAHQVVHRHGTVHGRAVGRRGRARELRRLRAGQRGDVQAAARRGGRGLSRGRIFLRDAARHDVSVDRAPG